MRLAIVVVMGLAAMAAHAQPGPDQLRPPGMTDALPPAPPDTGRSTDRVMVGLGGGVFANYPMSIGDPGVTLFAWQPLSVLSVGRRPPRAGRLWQRATARLRDGGSAFRFQPVPWLRVRTRIPL